MPKKASAKQVKSPKKTQSKTGTSSHPRRLHTPTRQLRRPRTWVIRKPKPKYSPLPKTSALVRQTFFLLKRDWRTLSGITVVYALLTLVLVRGLSFGSGSLAVLGELDEGATSFWDKIWASSVKLSTVLSDSAGGATAPTASLYQVIVFVVCSLALIYAFRQMRNNQAITVRRCFYQGMEQLVPFVLVLAFVSVQFLPIVVAGFLYNALIAQGIAIKWYEIWLSWAIVLGLVLWSLRMLTASIFATYIVTLPGMTPLRALRSAKQLVWRRRLQLWRKFLPFSLLVSLALLVLMLPIIFWLIGAAPYAVFLFSCAVFTVTHAFLYTLYRELL